MALKSVKTEAGHKAGRTGRKGLHREERKDASRKLRRRLDKLAAASAGE